MVAGVDSVEVAALVQGASKTMFHGKVKAVILLLLALGMGVAGFAASRHGAFAAPRDGAKPTEPPKGNVPPKTENGPKTIEISGHVLDPDGKPVAGAKLYLSYPSAKAMKYPVRATSREDGRFAFTFAKSELGQAPSDNPPLQVLAVARGHGCDWATVGEGTKVTLRLVKDLPIKGRILGPDGEPVVGAKLAVTGISDDKGDLKAFIEAVRKGRFRGYAFTKSWTAALPGQPAVLSTGADGSFRLTGAGRERVVRLHLEGPGIATADLEVMTRITAKTIKPDTAKGTSSGGGFGRAVPHVPEPIGHVHGASFTFSADASRPIRGVVCDKMTGKPLAGVSVEGLYSRWYNRRCQAVTDKDGRYELLGVPKAARYELTLKPVDGLHFQRRAELKDTGGLGALAGNLELVQGGVTVRGKVTDKEGKPIAHARVEYYPLNPNPNVRRKLAGIWYPRSEATTGRDGSYTLTVLPGAGVIGVVGPRKDAYMPAWVTFKERKAFFKTPMRDDGDSRGSLIPAVGETSAGGGLLMAAYNALVLLEPDAKEETLVKNVTLEPARKLTGRVVGPDGRPLTGVAVSGLAPLGLGVSQVEILKGAEFTVRGFNPKAPRQLVFSHKAKSLGFYVKDLSDEKPGPLTIKLQPCGSISGRLLNKDGLPLAGSRIWVDGGGVRRISAVVQVVATDKKGRFRAEGLVPGREYRLITVGAQSPVIVLVEPGKDKDLGDVKPDK